MTRSTAAMLAEHLTADNDTYELDDGRTVRLRILPDDVNPFDEYDCYGRVAPVPRDRTTGQAYRPDGFDGNACKVWTQSDQWWWQPPADAPRRGTPEFRAFSALVHDVLCYGLSVVQLELCGPDLDWYGRPVVHDVASLGGVDAPCGEHLAELIHDLASDLGITEREETK